VNRPRGAQDPPISFRGALKILGKDSPVWLDAVDGVTRLTNRIAGTTGLARHAAELAGPSHTARVNLSGKTAGRRCRPGRRRAFGSMGLPSLKQPMSGRSALPRRPRGGGFSAIVRCRGLIGWSWLWVVRSRHPFAVGEDGLAQRDRPVQITTRTGSTPLTIRTTARTLRCVPRTRTLVRSCRDRVHSPDGGSGVGCCT
jgi:hypothetical protein